MYDDLTSYHLLRTFSSPCYSCTTFSCVCVYPLSIRLDDDEWAEETFIFAHFPVQTIKQSLRHQQGMMHIFPSDSADTKREHHSSQEQRSWEVHSFFEGHISWLVWQSWHFYDHFFFCPLCEKSLQVLKELLRIDCVMTGRLHTHLHPIIWPFV